MGTERARTIKSSVARCTECDGTGLTCEATLADEVPFGSGRRSGLSAGKPSGGTQPKVQRRPVPESVTGPQLKNAPDRPGVFVTEERGLVITRCMRGGQTYADTASGRPPVGGRPTSLARKASLSGSTSVVPTQRPATSGEVKAALARATSVAHAGTEAYTLP